MSTETPPKERSVPKPVFTDAEAGSKEFPSSTSRSYNYFTPAKRRASVYEDVTVDVQPDPERHLTQGWIYGFADGTSGYPKEWTKLKSDNWHLFLDPNEEWEQTIYRNNANVVRQVQQNVANAKAAHAFAQWNRPWIDIVAKHVGAWAHAEHGLGMHVYTPANRDAPTNMINNALSVGAVHKLRFAQDVILYNLDLDDEIEAFDGQAHIRTWQEDPIWQKTRENVEQLTGIRDWAEAWFATAVVFEPLVGELFRSGFIMQTAALQGDFVTPTLFGSAESDTAREQRGARRLYAMLADDETHGAENKRTMQEWLTKWTPVSVEAARTLQPIWSQPAEKAMRFEESMERSQQRFGDLLSDIGLETPKEA
jgi:propane monooxygenase small subunit